MPLAPPDQPPVGEPWLDAAPYIGAKLRRGALHADVGCRSGETLVELARAFPRSHFVGFESSATRLERAESTIRAARLTDRVRLQLLRGTRGLRPTFDVISALDVAAHPGGAAALVRAVHDALAADGAAILSGVPGPVARELCLDAGFSLVRGITFEGRDLVEVRP